MVENLTEKEQCVLRNLVKQGSSLPELLKRFPKCRTTMRILFEVRSISLLQMASTLNTAAKKKVKDQSLSKREAYANSNLPWEDCDCIRLKSYFLQSMSMEDICLNMGRTSNAVLLQMEKMYPKESDRQALYENLSRFVRMKAIND